MRDRNFSALVILFLVFPLSAAPSETPETVNPPTRLLQFTIGLNRVQAPGLAGVTFAVYRDQEGGAPLWSETQSVDVDAAGKVSVVLGAIEKIPMEIFSSGEARWLGVQRLPEAEQPRILLASVPYAFKAGDADTLGGKPLSAFVLADRTQDGSDSGSVITRPTPIVIAPESASTMAPRTRPFVPVTNAAVATGFQLASTSGATSIGFATTGGAWNVYLKSSSAFDFDSTQLQMTVANNLMTLNGALTLGGGGSGNLNLPANGAIVKGGFRYLHSNGNVSTFVGFKAGTSTTTGTNNTGVGESALGTVASATGNTAVGAFSLSSMTGDADNTAVGSYAGAALATGADNVLVGEIAGISMTTGSRNTSVGKESAANLSGSNDDTAIGYHAMVNTTSGGNNIALGSNAGQLLSSGNNNIYIGSDGPLSLSSESSTTRIGSSLQTSTYISGIHGFTSASGVAVLINSTGKLGTTTSSIRYKDDVEDMGDATDNLMKLRPVTFRYKHEIDESGLQQYGLIAEEVAKVYPDLVVYKDDGTPETVRYHFINAMLLNEVQKQHRQIEEQQSMIEKLAARLAKLEAAK